MAQLVRGLATAALLSAAQASWAADQDAQVQKAMDRGRQLFLYDRAAWITSDDLVARLPQTRQPEIGGWVVTPWALGLHVDYFGKGNAADQVIYAADVNGGTVANAAVYPATSEPKLSELALRMAQALRAAWSEMGRHSDWGPCANARFNTIVLPPENDGSIPVYFLTPQTDASTFPFGGHYEVDITAAGGVASTRAFTRSCITMTKPPKSGKAEPAALFLTHILDPHPTEIHVFEQFYIGIPIFVGTGPKSVWKVEGGTIEDVSAMMKK